MKNIFSVIIFYFLSIIPLFSQNEKVLMTIGDQSVSVEEFERIYNKNNIVGVTEKQPVAEYLDLFINFKLKVLEAEKLGMDTVASFINELKGYRDQLAKPYINDSVTQEELMKQQYERMKTELHVSHILIRLDPKASPADTLSAYNRITEIRSRILAGEKFEDVARTTSEDPSAEKNGGDIGWISAFRTVWEFENAIYNTPVNQISMPVRTQFGYHIAKVMEQRPSPGTVQVAHIYVAAPEDMSPDLKEAAILKIFAVYDSLRNGADFGTLAFNNSDDRSTASEGGELPWFGSGQMIPEFENAAFNMKSIGEYTKPIQSFYGWHILKLLGKQGMQSYEESRPDLLSKLTDTPISVVKRKNYLNKLKTEYEYTFNKAEFEKLTNVIDTSIFGGNWSDSNLKNNKNVLFSIGEKKYTVADFAAYLSANQRKTDVYSVPVFLNENFEVFSDNAVSDYEKDLLVYKYPEFRYILQEYHDGILLFDLTDKMVWSKAVQDTTGLEAFYKKNKKNYVWEKRADVMIFSADSLELLEAAKALAIKEGKNKKFNPEYALSKLCVNDSIKNCIAITEGKYEKGDNEEVDKTEWIKGAGANYQTSGLNSFVFVKGVLKPQPKKLDEARGLITSDYQNFLEKEWIAQLRAKYPVVVNQELLKTIK